MATPKRKTLPSPRERGYRDGFETVDARESGPEYMAGYARGQADRQAAHERMNENIRRENAMIRNDLIRRGKLPGDVAA